MELEWYVYLLAMAAAGFAGFADAIVGGGGLITTPVLLSINLPPHLALATSKLQSTMGALSAVYTLRRSIDWARMWPAAALTFVASCAGAAALLLVSPEVLKPIIAGFLIVVFIYMMLRPKMSQQVRAPKMSAGVFYAIFCVILGFYDGFFGPGTGSFWILALVALQGLDIKQASIRTKLLNAASNVAALGYFALSYEIMFKLGILMGLGSIIGASLGARMLLRMNTRLISWCFNLIVVALLIKLVFSIA